MVTEPSTDHARRAVVVSVVCGAAWAALVFVLLVVAGVGAVPALVVSLVLSTGLTWLATWRSDRVVLRVSRAEEARPADHPRLHNLVEGLCVAMGLAKPALYVVRDDAPNALATGRSADRSAVVVTTGLLDRLNRIELEAVLARELNRIRSHEIAVGTVAVTTVGLPVLVADLLVRQRWWNGGRHRSDDRADGRLPVVAPVGTAILAASPLLARAVHAAIGPDRGVQADLAAVATTRYPPGLLSALEKLERESTVVHAGLRSTAHLWMEAPVAATDDEGHLARRNRDFLVQTPLAERIETLREL